LSRLLCEHSGVVVAITPLDLQPFMRDAQLSAVATFSDGALYQAKRTGKNRVVTARPRERQT